MDWIPIGESIPVLTANQERIRDMLRENKSILYICHTMRMRREHVEEEIYDIRRKESIMGNPTTSGKLSPQQKAAIYEAYKNGEKQPALAKQYGVCNQAISYTIKKMREAEQDMAAAVDLPAAAQVPEQKPKPAAINQDFENAIDKMIEDAKEKDANAEKKSENAEENSANAKPELLPPVVLRAVNQHLQDIDDRIEQLQGRIDEIKMEIEEWQKDAEKLRAWRNEQAWK